MNNDLGYAIARRLRGFTIVAPEFGVEPPEWTFAAVCQSVDPEIFFPEKGGSTREAKSVCAVCPVRAECLRDALAYERNTAGQFGIYGGLSGRERRTILQERYGVTCPTCGQRFRNLRLHLGQRGVCTHTAAVPA